MPTLLISKVLVGKSHVMHGKKDAACQQRKDVVSHASGDSLEEVVIFDPAQILPMFRVTLASTLRGAACLGMVDEVARLIAAGADVNETRSPLQDRTPLYMAAWRGSLAVVQLLITAGADVDKACTLNGATPLGVAFRHGNMAVAARLLMARAEVGAAEAGAREAGWARGSAEAAAAVAAVAAVAA